MSNQRKHAGVFDVARLAGVSVATVSRALSQPRLLKEETLRKVKAAVEKLGYVPHGVARALRSSQMHAIGAVIPTLENAIFAATASALQRVLDASGYQLLLACNDYDLDAEVRHATKLIEHGVDAMVLVGTQHRPELLSLLSRFQVPFICAWAFDEGGSLPCVGFDHRKATSQVANHLLSLGHRRFGVISTSTRDNERAHDRLAGVVETLAAARIVLAPEQIVEKLFAYSDGRDGFRQLMLLPERPTAVICLNDVLAVGAMAAAYEQGLSVPDAVSITGCEDLEVAAAIPPGLTTVRYPTTEMGHFAGIHLLERLKGVTLQPNLVFPTKLIVRGTTSFPSPR